MGTIIMTTNNWTRPIGLERRANMQRNTHLRQCMAWKLATILIIALSTAAAKADDEIPGEPQRTPIALTNATVHPISGPSIENATVLFDQGKIVAVGKALTLPSDAQIIDVTGKHIYPGLFEAHSQLGLIEIGAVRATDDQTETGSVNPNARALIAVNPDSELIPVTRSNGVLLALAAPLGGLVSGKSAILQMDGWTYEDMALQAEAAMHIDWPRLTEPTRGDEEARKRAREQQQQAMRDIDQLFIDARAYAQARQHSDSTQAYDARLEAMRAVIDGSLPMIVHADELAQIESAVGFAVGQGVRIIILGGYDAPLCADLLIRHQVPVIVAAVHRLPQRAHEPYDHAYTLPKRLLDAKIPFCISGTGRSESWNARNLPYHAGTAVGYGLSRDEALKAITLYPAQILGVADRVGSLEPGKDATLIVTTGDPLEATSHVEAAFIQGRVVDLSNKQSKLYEKYREKYRRLQAQ